MSAPRFAPGFQGSQTTSARVTVYPTSDPGLGERATAPIVFNGTANDMSAAPSLISVSTQKTMGVPAGSFSLSVKAPSAFGNSRPNLLDMLLDDDWIDIELGVNGRMNHVMRGQIESVTEGVTVQAHGSQVRTYTVQGRDFGRVLDITPIWFNQFTSEDLSADVADQFYAGNDVAGNPAVTVERILKRFLTIFRRYKRAAWMLPEGMPSHSDDSQATREFVNFLAFNDNGFSNVPPRIALKANQMLSQGNSIWKLAQAWQDAMFCEMFTDLAPLGVRAVSNLEAAQTPSTSIPRAVFDPREAYGIDQTQMAVFFRDKPFLEQKLGRKGPWSRLPILEVPRFHVNNRSIGRGGMERFNAFFVSPSAAQETSSLDTQGPLWDLKDIERHGMRNFTVESPYLAKEGDLFTLSALQRELARDWNCLNPFLLNGTIGLGVMTPGARIGMRLRIAGSADEAGRGPGGIVEMDDDRQENYYIEHVGHQWSLPAGGRTSFGVTHGWRGSDDSQLKAIQEMAARYTLLSTDNGQDASASFAFA